jgi:hypothetical protein
MIINPYASSAASTIYWDEPSQLGTWALAEGGLKATSSSPVDVEAGIRLNAALDSSGDTYIEFLVVQDGVTPGNFGYIGFGLGQDGDASLNAGWWYTATGYLLWSNNAYAYHNGGGGPSGLATFVDGDVVRLCVRAGKLWWGLNSTWIGDPGAQTGELYSGMHGNYFPGVYGFKGNESARIRLSASEMAYAIPVGCGTMLP